MKGLRSWQLDNHQSLALYIAADARLSLTDYANDQIWQLDLGDGDRPTLALQTQYGGRVGLASLVPMWLHEGRVIYQYQAYHRPPQITHFAPNYIRVDAYISPDIHLIAEYWAMDSRAIGGCFTFSNKSDTPIPLRLDLFAHIGAQGREQKLGIITYDEGDNAIYMGALPHLNPVVVMPSARADINKNSPKIGLDFVMNPQQIYVARFVHAALPDVRASLTFAQNWLAENWSEHLNALAFNATALPIIRTGDDSWDWAIACSINRAVQAFLRPTQALPAASFVSARLPNYGYSPKGDGSDYGRYWNGQDPLLAYQLLSFIATISPNWARGIIHNYLAVQEKNGFIDYKPGLGGQKQGLLCIPILARMAWRYYQLTEDQPFLEAHFAQLWHFFNYWFADDNDHDQDGIPEWRDERQMGYVAFPTFAAWQRWSQSADVRYVETPDLTAYLLSEALCLQSIAKTIGEKTALKDLAAHIDRLKSALNDLWHDGHYAYRDRDTHRTLKGFELLADGRGDQKHSIDTAISPPNRLVIKLIGSFSRPAKISMSISGLDENGSTITEKVDESDFLWQGWQATYTTASVFSYIHDINCEGLSRVHDIRAVTLDTTHVDINALLPLWCGGITAEKISAITELITDEKRFNRPNGIAMVPATDAHYDPSSANGGGGVWPLWMALIIEGLLDNGLTKDAVAFMSKLLRTQTRVLEQTQNFDEFYHSDTIQGLGTANHLGGVVPLSTLLQTIGVFIINHQKVWVGGEFAWKRGISVEQHGVIVKRTSKTTRIKFPSGYEVTLTHPIEWQYVVDPHPKSPSSAPITKLIQPPTTERQKPTQTVTIEVQLDE